MIYGWEESEGGLLVPISAPPTRADTIKAGWRMVRDNFERDQIEGRLRLEHDLGIIEPILFERIQYASATVIEAEGVVVERLAD